MNTVEYPIELTFGNMVKVVANADVDCAAWFTTENADVLEIVNGKIKVQGIGNAELVIANNGKATTQTVCFDDEAVKFIEL